MKIHIEFNKPRAKKGASYRLPSTMRATWAAIGDVAYAYGQVIIHPRHVASCARHITRPDKRTKKRTVKATDIVTVG